MRCVVVSVAACVGIITDEVMTLTHYWGNTDIEHSSFGTADGRTSALFRLLRFKHGHPEQISKQVSWRLVRESRMSLQQTLAAEYWPHFVFPDVYGATVALNLKCTVETNPV